MNEGTHDTHDYEHVWPPYGVQIAEPDTRTVREYLRRNMIHANSLGLVAILSNALLRMEQQTHPPQWLVDAINSAHGRAVTLSCELAAAPRRGAAVTALPLLGWLVAAALLLVAAWLRLDLADARRAAERQRIERETVSDWADEYQREAAALDAECVRLRDQVATLQMLYAERTRELLAVNYRVIATNVAYKRRR